MPTKPQAPFIFGFEHNRAHTPRGGLYLGKDSKLEATQTRPFSPLPPSPLLSSPLTTPPPPPQPQP